MSENQARVSVRILEKEYHITCPMEERADLLDSAEFLNAKMREIRDSGKVVGLDRIAVIAALNMANELIRFRNRDSHLDSDVGSRLRILRERVESALEKGRQLELDGGLRVGFVHDANIERSFAQCKGAGRRPECV